MRPPMRSKSFGNLCRLAAARNGAASRRPASRCAARGTAAPVLSAASTAVPGHALAPVPERAPAPLRYTVVKDLPGYLRVRFGRLAFTADEGYGIAEQLLAIAGIDQVTTTPANGGVLVRYDQNAGTELRERMRRVFDGLQRGHIPVARATDEQQRFEVGNTFALSLAGKLMGFAARRVLLPAPVRFAWTLVRSVGFVKKGLYHLVIKRELSVEVLDATAIAASILTGMSDSAGSVMLLLDISDMMEVYTHARSRVELTQSLALNVGEVWLVTPEGERPVPFERVREGDLVRVRTGTMVPVDGTVRQGQAALNESSLTGESRLVLREPGSSVYAGTVVDEGSIVVEARKVGGQTRISNLVRLVDESETLKAGTQSRAERLADAIVPFNLAAFFGVLAITRNVTKAMSVLMVDYSCAIKISTPVAVMSALREAAARGMVVKGGKYLEALAEADTIVFDKTGTLTTAQPTVSKVISFDGMDPDAILHVAACLEEHFPHSMARAVVAEARRRDIGHPEEAHAEVSYVVAHGICSMLDGKRVVLGSAHYVFEDEGVPKPDDCEQTVREQASGCSVIYLAIDGALEGAIAITDPLRPEAAQTIARLRAAGFSHVLMLTGDARGAAQAAADTLGIDEYRAQVLPEDKARIVSELREQGRKVLMVGDGVNDSPALAAADCSLAMVDASDIAREVADVTLLNGSLDDIVELRRLAVGMMRRISRNYRFIVVFNTALIVGGVAGLLQPTATALLHNGSTALVTAGCMRRYLKDGGHRRGRTASSAALPADEVLMPGTVREALPAADAAGTDA